jgi:hypothetical protein
MFTCQLLGMVHGSNETLGECLGNYRLRFHCQNSPHCYFNKPMDLQVLIDRLGGGFKGTDLYSALRCPKCKSHKFLVICTPVHMSYGNLS